jgi:hypothetical protein
MTKTDFACAALAAVVLMWFLVSLVRCVREFLKWFIRSVFP